MSRLDATATAHQDSGAPTKPVFLLFLDVDGDQIRATTTGYPIILPVLADPDLSGQTFYQARGVLSVGDIQNSDSGVEALPIELSGMLLPDADLLDEIALREKWQGRRARIWVIIRNEARVQQGAIAVFHEGYMSAVTILPRASSQVIRLTVEGFNASFSDATGRSYLDQPEFDAADTSSAATIGAVNGAKTGNSDLPTSGYGPNGVAGGLFNPIALQ